jgi:hypothetical protein
MVWKSWRVRGVNFSYMSLVVPGGNPAMRGGKTRYRPIVPIRILAPSSLSPSDACLDSAADDTVFPPRIGASLGINLASAPRGQARGVGGMVVNVHYAPVSLLLSDGYETCEWTTTVGFSTVPMRWALLGHMGFLEYFDIQLLGARREVIIFPNQAFSGQFTVSAGTNP